MLLANIGPRNGGTGGKKQGYGSGKQTLRFRANGPAKVEEVDDARTFAEEKINELLENFLGINDADLCKLLLMFLELLISHLLILILRTINIRLSVSLMFHYLLASQIWELAKNQDNTMDFAEAIDNSDLEFFGFTDDFIFELLGAVTDAKSGRLAAATSSLGEF